MFYIHRRVICRHPNGWKYIIYHICIYCTPSSGVKLASGRARALCPDRIAVCWPTANVCTRMWHFDCFRRLQCAYYGTALNVHGRVLIQSQRQKYGLSFAHLIASIYYWFYTYYVCDVRTRSDGDMCFLRVRFVYRSIKKTIKTLRTSIGNGIVN